jgi:hypothetical protein
VLKTGLSDDRLVIRKTELTTALLLFQQHWPNAPDFLTAAISCKMSFIVTVLLCILTLKKYVVCASGVLGADDDKVDESGAGEEEEDEILAELKKKQAELRALSHQNTVMLRFLHKQAKEELQNQELRKKMAAADAEVLILISFY